MRKTITFLYAVLISISIFGQTSLSTGDIAFLSVNFDGSDDYSFILFKDIDANTTITFTDCGWSDGSASFICNVGDANGWTWLSGSALAAGTVITITNESSASIGTVSGVTSLLSSAGDQIFAYQGSASSPTFLAGINSNEVADDSNWNGEVTSNSTSALPDQLTNGTNAIRLHNMGSEVDNWQYNCTVVSGDVTTVRAAINNIANWSNNNGTAFSPSAPNCLWNITFASPPSTVTSVTVPSNATYSAGQNLDFTVSFNETITVNTTGGTPQLALTIGSTTRQATFVSGSGTANLLFRYTVQAGDSDTDGIAVGSLAANGGTIQNGSGTDADLTLNSIGSTTNVFVDGIAPTGYSVTIDQSPINAANDDAVSFTFASAEVGTTYNYAFTSSGAPGSVTGSGTIATASDQTTGIDISGLADGMITLSVTLTDVNGNTGAAATDTETKETVAPTGYSVTIDQSPINAANDDAVSFTFASAEVGTTYNYAFTSSGAPGSVTGSGTIATASDQITGIDISGLADGTITLTVTLTDVNGNTGAVATDTETKETVAPTGYSVTIDQSPINAANDDVVSFTFASAEVGTTYNYAFTSSGAPGSVTGSGTIATASDQITGIDISGLADGMITLTVTLTDVNGNTGAAATDTETKETVAPTGYSVTIDQSPINAANDDAVSFTFASAEVGTTYNYAFTSSGAPGSVTGSGTIATASDQITGIDISGLADGTITLTVTLTDVNGNTGAAATDTETKETVAPTGYSVTIDQSPINAANDDAVSFTFASAEVGTTYNYAFTSSGAPGSVTGSGIVATATDQITGIDINGLADGTITLTVTLTDVNGNTGAAATDTETKDASIPLDPTINVPSGAITVTTTNQTISGNYAENGITIHAYIDTDNNGTADNTTSLGSAIVTGNAWSFTVNLTADSVNNFVVQAEDASGNTSTYVDVPTITQTNTITWTGNTSNSWTTAGNWDTNTVPTSAANVIIPSGLTNYPTISSAVTVNSIEIASGASLIANTSVTANVTYNRNLPTTNWYLVSAPVSNETQEDIINNPSHNFATGSGSNIGIGAFTNNGANPWVYATNTTTGPLVSGAGVSMKLAAAGDVSITGNINTTNVSFPIATGTRNNFNLIGNPYTSFVNSSTFAAANTGLLSEETVWLWDGSQYVTYNNMSPIEVAPAQGFFVEAAGSGNVTFSTANQSHQNSDTFLRQVPNPTFELFIQNDSDKRSTKVFYANGKTKGFDNGYDSKMFAGISENFGIFTELLENNQGKKLAIQTLPNSNLETMIVPVGIIANAGEEITFSMSSKNLPTGVEIYLEDKVNNTMINLTERNHTLTLKTALNASGRFYIHTTAKRLSNEDIINNLNNVSIYKSASKEVTISGLQGSGDIKVFSILGKQVGSTSINSNGTSKIELPDLPSGIYIVRLSSEFGKLTRKIILE
ncbi:T9SS type A sorting domain-containing protein [Tenacibaculum jejuense]|uniref:Lumazine-binding domain-containing protein n=1 Tax=Tenacibaculum jejuense TaxID=584609 RepID=A0A238UEW0_9FLAO|nr:T9SS type A sorting domain-containing protein [Tenacibaculum jejuense]SNR17118.1 exported protein of unknown function [Tenacibaculum jejuense]